MGSKKFDLRRFIKVMYDLAQVRRIELKKLHVCSVLDVVVACEWYGFLYGCGVFECIEIENGELFVNSGGYCNRVNYCPFCGYKAKRQLKLRK